MDLLRVHSHRAFGDLESACRRRTGGSDNEASGFAAFESHDGKTLYYAKGIDIDGLWSVPVNGGDEAPVLDFPKGSFWGYWALAKTGIYFVNTESGPQPALQFLSFADKRVVHVAALKKTGPVCPRAGSVSRREIVFVHAGGPAEQRYHARGKLPMNWAAACALRGIGPYKADKILATKNDSLGRQNPE